MEDDEREILSLRSRRRRSSISFSSCFSSIPRHVDAHEILASSPVPSPRKSPGWFWSKKSQDSSSSTEIKAGRCKRMMSRMGRHRRHASADFSYDPLSYALNFDDDEGVHDYDHPMRSFTSRLQTPHMASDSDGRRSNLDFLGLTSAKMRNSVFQSVPEESPESEKKRRSFEFPSALMTKAFTETRSPSPKAETDMAVTRGYAELTSMRAAAVEEVKRSLEEGSPTTSREILVGTC